MKIQIQSQQVLLINNIIDYAILLFCAMYQMEFQKNAVTSVPNIQSVENGPIGCSSYIFPASKIQY